jgi:hypothetical protein
MKTIIKLLAILALTLSALAGTAPAALAARARPAYATGAETIQFSLKHDYATAFFESRSACINSFVAIAADNGREKETDSPNTMISRAAWLIQQYDLCNSVDPFFALGSDLLPEGAFQIDKKLNTATLNTTIEVFDFESGNSFPVDFSVNWTATGASIEQNDHFQIIEPDFVLIQRVMGTFRIANASGSVSLGSTNLTPHPAVRSTVGSSNQGSVTVIH